MGVIHYQYINFFEAAQSAVEQSELCTQIEVQQRIFQLKSELKNYTLTSLGMQETLVKVNNNVLHKRLSCLLAQAINNAISKKLIQEIHLYDQDYKRKVLQINRLYRYFDNIGESLNK